MDQVEDIVEGSEAPVEKSSGFVLVDLPPYTPTSPIFFPARSQTLDLLVHSILDLLALSILDLLVQNTFLVGLLTLLPIYQTFWKSSLLFQILWLEWRSLSLLLTLLTLLNLLLTWLSHL